MLGEASFLCALVDVGGHAAATPTVADPSSYGVVSVDDNDDLDAIVETPAEPPPNLADIGWYAFGPKVFDSTERTGEHERGEFEITDTLERSLPASEFYRFRLNSTLRLSTPKL